MTQAVQVQPPQPFDAKDGIRIAVQLTIDNEAHARGLKPAQVQLLNLIFDGLCDKEICEVMNLSMSGVKYQTALTLRAFGVRSRGEAIAICLGRR